MAMTLACKDAGQADCPYVASGENMEELFNDAGKHGKEVHNYTDEFLNDPANVEAMKKGIKTN